MKLFNEFFSIYNNKTEIDKDKNFLNGLRYKNIFELRKVKNNYLIDEMPILVPNYLLITYENLNKNPIEFLNLLKDKFNLVPKDDKFNIVKYYKDNKNKKYVPRKMTFSKNIIETIKKNLDLDIEKKIGYEL